MSAARTYGQEMGKNTRRAIKNAAGAAFLEKLLALFAGEILVERGDERVRVDAVRGWPPAMDSAEACGQ